MPREYLDLPTDHYDSKEEYTLAEARAIWDATDTLVYRFEAMLETQTGHIWTHEWDDGLTFFSWEVTDVEPVETQMSPKTRLILEALKSLVPLYLDSNAKVA